MTKKQILWIFLFWLILGILIGVITFISCGGFTPFICDCNHPIKYSAMQKVLFALTEYYAWPVTQLFKLIKNPFFDISAGPFYLEVADICIGPFVVVFYALFYTLVTVFMIGIWKKAFRKDKQIDSSTNTTQEKACQQEHK